MSVTAAAPKRSSWLKSFLIGTSVVVVGVVVLAVWAGASSAVPTCDEARPLLQEAFDKSQFARLQSLTAVAAEQPAQVSWDKASRTRICRAVLVLNNAERSPVDYQLAGNADGTYMLTFKAAK